ncbi:serine/threonine-protein kinase 35-like [Haliotis rubra]|uniref:serine/threonine-protein kinase 35-like n=1 Tax=Haliotis rubra TaxID=36100 RepID=UPI001EE5DA5E|nr:serine/threonine-protein kinase 35-like [Haliotis rubra]
MKIGGKYRIFETLGNGAFGKTHKVTNFRDAFALKEIEIQQSIDTSSVNTEIEAFENLPRHENIVTFIDHFTENNKIYVVLEFCEPGNLNDFAINEKMDDVAILRAMKDVAHGLQHMHKHNVVHGNVKPQNIMLTLSHGNKPIFKLSDFNLTKCSCSRDILSSSFAGNQPLGAYISGPCGLTLYWAPEYKEGQFSSSGDVFSLGVVVYALFSMRLEKKTLCPAVKSAGDDRPMALCSDDEIETAVKATVSDGVKGIVGRMLAVDPTGRPTINDVLDTI